VITRAQLLLAASIFASVALVVAYLAAGGGAYEPTPVADPCTPRAWSSPNGLEEDAQQFLLSGLDGAACKLGVSRETLAAALATEESRDAFAAEHGIGDAELEDAVRAGLVRAIDDAEDAGALNPLAADGLRAVASRLPVNEAIDLIAGGKSVFDDASGLLDRLGGLIDDAGGLLGGLLPKDGG
jgi:hypothetical protein